MQDEPEVRVGFSRKISLKGKIGVLGIDLLDDSDIHPASLPTLNEILPGIEDIRAFSAGCFHFGFHQLDRPLPDRQRTLGNFAPVEFDQVLKDLEWRNYEHVKEALCSFDLVDGHGLRVFVERPLDLVPYLALWLVLGSECVQPSTKRPLLVVSLRSKREDILPSAGLIRHGQDLEGDPRNIGKPVFSASVGFVVLSGRGTSQMGTRSQSGDGVIRVSRYRFTRSLAEANVTS
jgi:hypothetical protein